MTASPKTWYQPASMGGAPSPMMGYVQHPWLSPKKKKLNEIRERLEGLIKEGLGEPSGAYAEARNRELAAGMRTQAQLGSEAERRLSENLAGRGMTYSGMYKEGVAPIQEGRFGRMAELQRGAATDIAGREAQDRAQAIQQGMGWEQQEEQRHDRLLGIGLRGGLSAAPAGRDFFRPKQILGVLRPPANLRAKQQGLQGIEEEIRQLMKDMPEVGGAWEAPEADASTFLPREPGEDWLEDLA